MFARTERLLLRPGFAEDASALTVAIGDQAVLRNLARAPAPYTLDDARRFLASSGDAGLPRLLILLRSEGAPRLIGGIGLHRDAAGAAELGYWIAPAWWGRGVATEAGHAVVAMARRSLRLPRIVAGHALDNPASGRVLRKLGFSATGRVATRQSLGRGEAMECAELALDLSEDGPMSARLAA